MYAAQKTCGALCGRGKACGAGYAGLRAKPGTAQNSRARGAETCQSCRARARCKGALFLCGVCCAGSAAGTQGRGRGGTGQGHGHAGAQWIFCGRRWAQGRARCKGEGKGAGAQWIFCGRRGHGHTAGLFTAGAGAWAHRGSARRGIAAHFGAGVRIGTWRLFSLRQKNNAPSGAMKCTQKEGACSGPRLGLWFSRRLRGLFAAGPLTARNPDFGLSASPGQI